MANSEKKPSGKKLQQICKVAASLFFEKGFWQTSARDIAGLRGISVGTLYHYINSKYDFPRIFSKVHIRDIRKWEREVRKEMESLAPEELLKKAVRSYLYLIDSRDKMVLFWYNTCQHLEWDQLEDIVHTDLRTVRVFKEILDRGCREGQYKTCDPVLAAVNIEMLCHTWVLKGWYLYHFYTVEQYADACERYALQLARGSAEMTLPTPAGIEVEHFNANWDRERKEKPDGHGCDSWARYKVEDL